MCVILLITHLSSHPAHDSPSSPTPRLPHTCDSRTPLLSTTDEPRVGIPLLLRVPLWPSLAATDAARPTPSAGHWRSSPPGIARRSRGSRQQPRPRSASPMAAQAGPPVTLRASGAATAGRLPPFWLPQAPRPTTSNQCCFDVAEGTHPVHHCSSLSTDLDRCS
jgi:hypothetical protein